MHITTATVGLYVHSNAMSRGQHFPDIFPILLPSHFFSIFLLTCSLSLKGSDIDAPSMGEHSQSLKYFIFTILYLSVFYLHVYLCTICLQYPQGQKKIWHALELGLQMVVICRMSAGD